MTRPKMSGAGLFRQWLEFVLVWSLVKLLGLLRREAARKLGQAIGWVASRLTRGLWRTGIRNLELAYPEWTASQRTVILRGVYRNLGILLAEFCLMPRYGAADVERVMRYSGLDHYLSAVRRGKGVLILTGHLGAWELSSFLHSLNGHPMGLVIRHLDNSLIDSLVNQIRCRHGNWVISKDQFARGIITSMRAGKTVGILMDTNMTPPQGVFVPFFGVEACTASGMARVALKTDAAVLPGFLLATGSTRYTLGFGEPLTLIRSGDLDADVLANTAMFTAVLEGYVRQYPDQWLWLHRRWKTRPAGESNIYSCPPQGK